jgi:hypothetical protein
MDKLRSAALEHLALPTTHSPHTTLQPPKQSQSESKPKQLTQHPYFTQRPHKGRRRAACMGAGQCNVHVNVISLGLANATEEQQVYSAIWDLPMLQGV